MNLADCVGIFSAVTQVHHVDFRAKTDTLLRESIAEYDK
jgi:hypothetical protein